MKTAFNVDDTFLDKLLIDQLTQVIYAPVEKRPKINALLKLGAKLQPTKGNIKDTLEKFYNSTYRFPEQLNLEEFLDQTESLFNKALSQEDRAKYAFYLCNECASNCEQASLEDKSLISFLKDLPTELKLEILEKTSGYRLSPNSLDKLLQQHHEQYHPSTKPAAKKAKTNTGKTKPGTKKPSQKPKNPTPKPGEKRKRDD